ncbi:hypothetical protein [Fimbriiglobus ruber]|uniref:hypothetical protein n=1 Tax=Fimbriiglobus ruber TaxID=1908690 RepID=UPI00117BBAFB|nr:hypothetical protein [Fimbriiglobus ruber]
MSIDEKAFLEACQAHCRVAEHGLAHPEALKAAIMAYEGAKVEQQPDDWGLDLLIDGKAFNDALPVGPDDKFNAYHLDEGNLRYFLVRYLKAARPKRELVAPVESVKDRLQRQSVEALLRESRAKVKPLVDKEREAEGSVENIRLGGISREAAADIHKMKGAKALCKPDLSISSENEKPRRGTVMSEDERAAMLNGSFQLPVKSNVSCIACDESHMQPTDKTDFKGRLEFKCRRCGSKRKMANWPTPSNEIKGDQQ